MRVSRRYLAAVILLAVFAVAFGVFGTVAPPLAEGGGPAPQQKSSSESVGHFQNPPSYDSGWADIRSKAGQYMTLNHGLNTTEVVVDITGKQSLDPIGGAFIWSKTYGGTSTDVGQSLVQTSDGGYALAGYTYSYGAGSDDFWLVKTDAAGNMLWNRTYGGASYDVANSVVQTGDGGYALAGATESFGSARQMYLVKTTADGTMAWNKTYGGGSTDYVTSFVQTEDGGYALAGITDSFGLGWQVYLVKTYADGTMNWQRTYGGGSYEAALSVVQTGDGGYALAGVTESFGSSQQVYLVKTSADGTMAWNKTYGGTGYDRAQSMVQTSDGGYSVAGYTNSYGAGGYDFWLIKTSGVLESEHQKLFGGTSLPGWHGSDIPGWNQTFGGTSNDTAYAVFSYSDYYIIVGATQSYGAGNNDFWLVQITPKTGYLTTRTRGGSGDDVARSVALRSGPGGYTLAGYTNSYGAGGYDFWLVSYDTGLSYRWNKTYGGADDDRAYSVLEASGGGYAIAGCTRSSGSGGYDFWLVRTDDAAGNMLWNKTYGGPGQDIAYSIIRTRDGGYAVTGSTDSYGAGGLDSWLVKTDSAGNLQWSKTYGGSSNDETYSLVQTSDGGYALAGYTRSYGALGNDFWLVKTDATGNMQWTRTYGGISDDIAYSLARTSDGGYAIAGSSGLYGLGGYDFWLIKTDLTGNMQWSKTYGGTGDEIPYSMIQTSDRGYAMTGYTASYGAGAADFWLVKVGSEAGLTWTDLTSTMITLYRGADDPYWDYVRVRIWLIKEPSWVYGDINMDGVVDAKDLYIVGRNYGKTFSLLSLSGIIGIAGVRTVKKRKQSKKPSYS